MYWRLVALSISIVLSICQNGLLLFNHDLAGESGDTRGQTSSQGRLCWFVTDCQATRDYCIFVVYSLLQVSHGPYYVFYSIYLHQFDYASTTIGLLWALGVGAEVLLFVFMKQILKCVSLRNILLISIVLGIGRWLLIAFLWIALV